MMLLASIISKPDTQRKLEILSVDGQYDLACACGAKDTPGRQRGGDGNWIYPITLPNGGKSVLFKTLMSNVCSNDCKYCPLRDENDVRRCALTPEETAAAFMDYYRKKKVFGLFLSSAVGKSPDATMAKLNAVAAILRKNYRFRGFIHLKIMAGASKAAIEQSLSLASNVSLNIETPGEKNMLKLSEKKQYIRDIIEPIKFISEITAKGRKFDRVKQTTQFIVGAADEMDSEIVKYMSGLYERLKMHRVYFSAYQKSLGQAEINENTQNDAFTREHRLYQVDFLFRKYGFKESDIFFGKKGSLSLTTDPKEVWANNHPEVFPININSASKFQLLKVPGLGPITVNRIIKRRKQAKIGEIAHIGKPGKLLHKAEKYIVF
ncbi:MAG: radical SAM protein [Planctomycetes bacterium]|nr:radical SAM protein [Planctomycetota bacterium]